MAQFAKVDKDNNILRIEEVANSVITDSDGNEQEQAGINFLTQLYDGGWYRQIKDEEII